MRSNSWQVVLIVLAVILFSQVGCALILEEDGDEEEGLITYRVTVVRDAEKRPGSRVTTHRVELKCEAMGGKVPQSCEDGALPWAFDVPKLAAVGRAEIVDVRNPRTRMRVFPFHGSSATCNVLGVFGDELIKVVDGERIARAVTARNRVIPSSPISDKPFRIVGGYFEQVVYCPNE